MRLQEEVSTVGWSRRVAWAVAVSGMAGALALSGCGKFFPPLTSGGGTTGSSGDYLFAGNLGPGTVAGFSIANAALSVAAGSPHTVSLVPPSLAVTPNDDYLFVGGPGGIYTYAIESGGALAAAGNGGYA